LRRGAVCPPFALRASPPEDIFAKKIDGRVTVDLKQRLARQALAEGFGKVGICAPGAIPEAAARLAGFVAKGHHGQMGWMAERMAWRG